MGMNNFKCYGGTISCLDTPCIGWGHRAGGNVEGGRLCKGETRRGGYATVCDCTPFACPPAISSSRKFHYERPPSDGLRSIWESNFTRGEHGRAQGEVTGESTSGAWGIFFLFD
ncbi:unnamed protein product [Victoria cruziana]